MSTRRHGEEEQPTFEIVHGTNLSENERRMDSGREFTPGREVGPSEVSFVAELILTCSRC